MSSTAAAAAAITSPGAEHKPILAERFKTKMCRNYQVHGSCPYEQRCMFAHGDDDLRTKDMNLRDHLTSEDAIKAFQRAKYAAKQREALLAVAEESTDNSDVIKRNPDGSYSHNPYARWSPFFDSVMPPQPRETESALVSPTFEQGWTTYGCTCPSCLHGVPMPPPPKYIPTETSGPRHKVLVP